MCKHLWLIRHAQSIANQQKIIQGQGSIDTELTELGIAQAKAASDYFMRLKHDFNINEIYSSDLKRTAQTAVIISKPLGLEVEFDIGLREAHFGKWEGLHAPTLEKEDPINYKKWQEEKLWRPDWCESFIDLQNRAITTLKRIISIPNNKDIIIVSHGGWIASVIACLSQEFGIHPSSYNCGISKLLVDKQSKIIVESFNYTEI